MPNLAARAPRAADGKPDLSGVWHVQPTPLAELRRLFGDRFDNALKGSVKTSRRPKSEAHGRDQCRIGRFSEDPESRVKCHFLRIPAESRFLYLLVRRNGKV